MGHPVVSATTLMGGGEETTTCWNMGKKDGTCIKIEADKHKGVGLINNTKIEIKEHASEIYRICFPYVQGADN